MADPDSFDRMTEQLRTVAQSSPPQALTAATQEQVDLVVELGAVAREVIEHNRRVLVGDPVDWAGLADLLTAAARACRNQIVVDQ